MGNSESFQNHSTEVLNPTMHSVGPTDNSQIQQNRLPNTTNDNKTGTLKVINTSEYPAPTFSNDFKVPFNERDDIFFTKFTSNQQPNQQTQQPQVQKQEVSQKPFQQQSRLSQSLQKATTMTLSRPKTPINNATAVENTANNNNKSSLSKGGLLFTSTSAPNFNSKENGNLKTSNTSSAVPQAKLAQHHHHQEEELLTPKTKRKLFMVSSTSTLLIASTITVPKDAELILSIAEYWQSQIEPIENLSPKNTIGFEIFDETLHPLNSQKVDRRKIPSSTTMFTFIKEVFRIGQLQPETLIMSISYINRMRKNTDLRLFPFNWRRLILSSLILASKVWEDAAVWNADFVDSFKCSSPHDLAELERRLLALLAFNVSLKPSEYASIYFDVRAKSTNISYSEKKPLEHDEIKKFLSHEGISKLEMSSTYTNRHGIKAKLRNSFDDLSMHKAKLHHGRAVLG